MFAEIIRIGNSKGIRIPKTVMNQCNIKDKVIINVKGNSLIITAYEVARDGWEESFRKMKLNGDDKLISGEPFNNSFDDEWEW